MLTAEEKRELELFNELAESDPESLSDADLARGVELERKTKEPASSEPVLPDYSQAQPVNFLQQMLPERIDVTSVFDDQMEFGKLPPTYTLVDARKGGHLWGGVTPFTPQKPHKPVFHEFLEESPAKQADNISKYPESTPTGQIFPNIARRLNALSVSDEGVLEGDPTRPLGKPGALLGPAFDDVLELPGRLMVVASDPSESLNKTSADYLREGKLWKSMITDPTMTLPGVQAKGALPILASDGLATVRKIYPVQRFLNTVGEVVGAVKKGAQESLPQVVPFASKKVLGGAAEGAALADLSADVTAHQDATPWQIGIGSALGALSGILGAAGPILKFGSDSPYLASKEAYQMAVDPLARHSALSALERTAADASGQVHNLPEFSNENAGLVYKVYADEAKRLQKLFERGRLTKGELAKKMAPMESMLEGVGFAGSEVDAEQMIRYAKRLSQTNPAASKDLMSLASEKIAEVRASGRLGKLTMPKQNMVNDAERAIQLLTAPTKEGKAATVVPLIEYMSAPVREGLLGPLPKSVSPFIPEEKEVGPQSSLIEIPEGDLIPEQRRGIIKFG